ncbi:hypothetical protein ASESINO_25 [Erwinia phage vB_EamM_Asesino]|uniref:Uncharacterized protein n=1 Tax=Erwinia phage vB_EamM_Asesino TaxID=1883370 RepID=A0A1B2I9T6_9CAUD|nr:hypothetical protein ASESINO_25 [Erwinia phage vB_EamM_Asesino]ANZ48038.1 hypothetical protein ASESINO_25 [Erwinia phage vB_EamM_Asesino]
MSVIDYCLRRVRRKIPEPILRAAFVPENMRLLGIASSLDNEIMEKVFKEYLIPEVSRMGQYTEIDLQGVAFENDTQDYYSRVYYIDDIKTGGRPLIDAHLAVTPVAGQAYTLPPAGSYLDGATSGIMASTQQVVDSQSAMPRIGSPECKVLGPNVIRIKDPGMFVYATKIMAKFMLSDDLNEIKAPFWPVVADLAVYATKEQIYNKMMFDMDAGKIENGMEFGAFRNIIEGYSDAGEMFDDNLPRMQRALVHNDDLGNRYNYLNGGRYKA